jgi:hypothetical protein
MSGAESPLEAAKARLDIPALWQILGLPDLPGRSCHCPWREDRNASFSVYDSGLRWRDFSTGEGGDAADFVARACGLSPAEGAHRLIELAGVSAAVASAVARPRPGRDRSAELAEKEKKRLSWPSCEAPSGKEIAAIAGARGFSVEALRFTVDRGLLWCADSGEGRAWIVTDAERRNAQARLISGKRWESLGGKKARTLPGSDAAWPIGLKDALPFPAITLCEGGTDFLAAFHLCWCAGVENDVAPVAMLGASLSIPDDALALFTGKRVRIFPDADSPGRAACSRWARQLASVSCDVDAFDFQGLVTAFGAPVGDLCDFVTLDVDQWESEWDAIDDAFLFAGNEQR